ncbi:hypothetical protein B0H13DRAFT_1629328, partial [Mycena leptocephala]
CSHHCLFEMIVKPIWTQRHTRNSAMSLEILRKGLCTLKKIRNGEQDREKNGGDDDEEVEPKPSRKEVLQAASTLCKYIADLDDPFARKMEAMLSMFGHETCREEARAMVDTEITDYFTCM